jgi:arylsulfatase A
MKKTLLALAGLTACSTAGTAQETRHPNIVFILADDLGVDGVGCYGSEKLAQSTPQIDRMAAGGLRFTHCYAQTVCVPTRSAFLTGLYPAHSGSLHIDGSEVLAKPPRCPFFVSDIKEAGYQTAVVGKKHSIGDPAAGGFEEWLLGPSNEYYGSTVDDNGKTISIPEGVENFPANFLPDIYHKRVIKILEQAAGNKKPLFLYYSMLSPHTSSQKPYSGLMPPVPAHPDEKDDKVRYRHHIEDLDAKVGDLLAQLERLGMRDNTVVAITGDNGSLVKYQSPIKDPASGAFRRVLGSKNSLKNDGGSLVPLVISWLAVIKQPAVRNELIDFTDFSATFLDLAGAAPMKVCDGHSFAGLLNGSKDWTPRRFVYVQRLGEWYARSPDFRLNSDGTLLDMSDAPFSDAPAGGEKTSAIRVELQAALDATDPEHGITLEYCRNKLNGDETGKWKAKHWNYRDVWDVNISGDAADPDKDGIPNAQERANGTDPNKPD